MSTSSTTMPAIDPGARTILRHRFREDVAALPLLWAGYVVLVAAFAGVVAGTRGPLAVSTWEQAISLPKWYALGLGVYFTAVHLPLYLAHGYTRGEFFRQLPALVLAHSVLIAVLVTAGFAIEGLAYGAFGWSQELTQSHLFAAPDEYLLILVEHLAAFLVYTAVGCAAGAAFYRRLALGFLAVPLGLLAVGAVEFANGAIPATPVVIPLFDLGESIVGALSLGVGIFTAIMAATWLVVRDLPVRPK